MSLIVEPALDCQFSPRKFHACAQVPHCALKALQPTPHLGWESNLLAKKL